jgi:hypothetical protein
MLNTLTCFASLSVAAAWHTAVPLRTSSPVQSGVHPVQSGVHVRMQIWSDGKAGRRSRFEDGDDKRLSAGGSGGRYGKSAPVLGKGTKRRVGVSATEGFGMSQSQQIRQAKVSATQITAFHVRLNTTLLFNS